MPVGLHGVLVTSLLIKRERAVEKECVIAVILYNMGLNDEHQHEQDPPEIVSEHDLKLSFNLNPYVIPLFENQSVIE